MFHADFSEFHPPRPITLRNKLMYRSPVPEILSYRLKVRVADEGCFFVGKKVEENHREIANAENDEAKRF